MAKSPPAGEATQVAVLAFDGITPFHLSVPCMVFGSEPGGGPGMPSFKLSVFAAERGMLRTASGFDVAITHGLGVLARADMIVIPSWHDPLRGGWKPPPEALLKALRAAHRRGARIVGLCLGAYVLAEAGLLDGRTATTHWALAKEFGARYPQVGLQADVLYVDDGDILTSAGTAAGIDCCLHILRVHFGAEVANRMARRLVVAPHRQGGQAQYVEQPLPATGADERLSGVLEWVGRHLDRAHSLDDLARRALLSRRTFTRHFRKVTGTTVGHWLLNQRLALAQRRLESTGHNIDRIATDAGFGTAASLRQHFSAAFRTSPSQYRREFRAR